MKESVCIFLDEELNKVVNEETTKNGFCLDEFVNAALKEKFGLNDEGLLINEILANVLNEKLKERHTIFKRPASDFMRGNWCYQDAELNKLNCEIDQIRKLQRKFIKGGL